MGLVSFTDLLLWTRLDPHPFKYTSLLSELQKKTTTASTTTATITTVATTTITTTTTTMTTTTTTTTTTTKTTTTTTITKATHDAVKFSERSQKI